MISTEIYQKMPIFLQEFPQEVLAEFLPENPNVITPAISLRIPLEIPQRIISRIPLGLPLETHAEISAIILDGINPAILAVTSSWISSEFDPDIFQGILPAMPLCILLEILFRIL